jgi:hypothetical protein
MVATTVAATTADAINGRRLAVASANGLVVFDTETGGEVAKFERREPILAVQFLDDLRGVVTLDTNGRVSVWRLPE